MKFKLEIADEDAQRRLSNLIRAGQDMTPMMDAIRSRVLSDTRENFNKQRDPGRGQGLGRKWKSLSPKYAAHRKRRGKGVPPGRILVYSGDLLNSITGFATRNMAVIGSNLLYARFHQFGTRRMAKRPFLGITPTARRDALEIINDHIRRNLA